MLMEKRKKELSEGKKMRKIGKKKKKKKKMMKNIMENGLKN